MREAHQIWNHSVQFGSWIHGRLLLLIDVHALQTFIDYSWLIYKQSRARCGCFKKCNPLEDHLNHSRTANHFQIVLFKSSGKNSWIFSYCSFYWGKPEDHSTSVFSNTMQLLPSITNSRRQYLTNQGMRLNNQKKLEKSRNIVDCSVLFCCWLSLIRQPKAYYLGTRLHDHLSFYRIACPTWKTFQIVLRGNYFSHYDQRDLNLWDKKLITG